MVNRYNLPTNASNNITGLYSLFQYNQEVSSNWFVPLITFSIAVIMFIALKDYETPKAFVAAAFFNMVFMVIFSMVGFISSTFMYISVVLVGVGVVWVHISNSGRF